MPRPVNHHVEILRHIDQLLEPAEVCGSVRQGSLKYDEMPNSVRSVVEFSLRDDDDMGSLAGGAEDQQQLHQIVTNSITMDQVLGRFNKFDDAAERSQFKVQVEKEARILVSKMIAQKLK